MKFIIVSSLILFSSLSWAQSKSFQINGQPLELKNAKYDRGTLVEGELAAVSTIKFRGNELVNVPVGTFIKIVKTESNNLNISLMVFGKKFEDQVWSVGADQVKINCSVHQGLNARVVSFYPNLQMNGRCAAVGGDAISTPDGGRVVLGAGAQIFFTESGLLKSATKVSEGYVFVNKQKVKLYKDSFLDYDSKGKLHFLYMAEGESFTIPTKLSPVTAFKQFPGERHLPFIFYSDGSVESGRVSIDGELSIEPLIFGQTYEIKIKDGQMGFDEQGRLNRMIVKEDLTVVLEEDEEISFVSIEDRTSIPVTMKAGEDFPIEKGRHLFVSYDGNQLVLDGFPVVVQGQRYFLSLTGNSAFLPEVH